MLFYVKTIYLYYQELWILTDFYYNASEIKSHAFSAKISLLFVTFPLYRKGFGIAIKK